MKMIEVAVLGLALSALAGGAARGDDGPLALPPAPRPPGLWQVSLGMRDSAFRDAGYDPFSVNDAFVQASIGGSRAFRTGGPFTPAVGVSWETGVADATARGGQAHLRLSRLSAVLEGRLALRS